MKTVYQLLGPESDLRIPSTGKMERVLRESSFCRDHSNPDLAEHIDEDGLPAVGARVGLEDPFYW